MVGAGTGLANPLVTFAHLGVLPPAQGGLASGINNTARQLGLAVGIAVLGALLQSRIAERVGARTDGLGSARAAVTDRIADGDVAAATRLAPPAACESLRSTYDAAFASGLNEILPISAALALAGRAAAVVLVRARPLAFPLNLAHRGSPGCIVATCTVPGAPRCSPASRWRASSGARRGRRATSRATAWQAGATG